jgi:hypothetical protein
MDLSANALNAFLAASASRRTFSFGDSSFYDGKCFEDLLYHDWVTLPVVRRFEQRVLKRLRSAYHAISVFMNYAEASFRPSLQARSPAFTETTEFAYDIQNILNANHTPPSTESAATPHQEDDQWAQELQDSLSRAHLLPLPKSRPESRTACANVLDTISPPTSSSTPVRAH